MNVKLLCNALLAAALCGASLPASAADGKVPNQGNKYVFHSTGNPYLPLWEHVPDGEPRVFEDPDNPGKYRVYIIGSHDVRYDSYCVRTSARGQHRWKTSANGVTTARFSLTASTTSGT